MEKVAVNVTTSHPTRVEQLNALIRVAQERGIRIRREWLHGQAAGACEIAGTKWVFVDQSLPLEEQIGQLREALEMWEN